ncbi:MAG: response regulator [Lachnospiraceae bacterium]|nr:response regulator [Lachnospiraceae bacterium]
MNLLIVDDEPLIHVSIEYSLNELQVDHVTVHHAYTGTEMLKVLEEHPIDIALVDIRMPGMDGLEAIHQGKNISPQTFYYIMSGYSEFEYAREAVRLNVVEYLLKPLDPDALKQVLLRVKKEQADRAQLVRDRFRGWMEGTLHRHDVTSLFAKNHYAAIILLTYDSNQENHLFWTPSFAESHHDYLLSLPCQEGMLLLAYASNTKIIYEILNQIPKKDLSAGITAFVSSVSNEPHKLAEQMHLMLDFSPARVFYGIGQRYDASVLPKVEKELLALAAQWITLRDHLFEDHYTSYLSLTARLIGSISDPLISNPASANLLQFVRTITGKSDRPATIGQLESALNQAGESILMQHRSVDKIEAVLSYVEEHYCDNISISSLSAHFDLTPNYLSTLLKNRLGTKFTDHLTYLRIAHAKELLLTTKLSVKEITEQVGYYSQSHFTKLFMEKEGCTPAEFRNRNHK